MKEKLIAGFMAALMTLMTAVYPVLGATALKDFPTFLGTDGQANFYVVMGADADPSDVAGAVDVAVRLAELSYTVGAAVGGAVTGIEKDTVPLTGTLVAGTFPNPIKTIHYSGLQDSVFRWKGNDYDYYEDIALGTIGFSHNFGTDKINGTEKMYVSSSDGLMYEFVFDKILNGTGSTTDKNYTYPINIKLLGKDFSIVGTGSNSIIALVGTVGTASATSAVVYGNYSVYSDLGYNGAWARVIVKDAAGNTVDTKVINQADSWDFSAISLTVKVTSVRALQDGTVVGVDLVVGPTGTVERTYTTGCDVSSTGTEDKKFPGETNWCIQVKTGSFAYAGQISKGDTIQVAFKPADTQYYVKGGEISLPNNYGKIGYEGWNTDNFVSITVVPVSERTPYKLSSTSTGLGTWSGFEITADVTGSILDTDGTGYSKAYLLFAKGPTDNYMNVSVGFYDSVNQKILVDTSTSAKYTTLNNTLATDSFTFTFNVSYGGASVLADQQHLTFVVNDSAANIMKNVTIEGVQMAYQNRTTWTPTNLPAFRLSAEDSAADADVLASTDGTVSVYESSIGKATQDVVTDGGNIVVSPVSNSGSQRVIVQVPAKGLYVKAYVGKLGAAAAGGAHVIAPVKTAVAVMDTEVTAAHKTKNFVSVGGPCVNRITAAALNVSFPTCGAAGATALGIASGEALIKIVDDYPATGLKTVVVVGYEKEQTRTACSVLQQYDTLLAGQTASAVKVTGLTAAGITPM